MKVLIVDDDATTRKILSLALKKLGYDTIVLDNPHTALEELIRTDDDAPKLAIVDWMMPEMDGIELCRKVKAVTVDNPPYLIMLTGKDSTNDIVKGLTSGANDYISKPYHNYELVARLKVGERVVKLQNKLIDAYNQMRTRALYDSLTGIHNRGAVMELLEGGLNRVQRRNGCMYLAIMDIDFFKKVNDLHGHLVGDDVLRGFVAIVKEQLRKYDYFGRYGGEEFLYAFECDDCTDEFFKTRLDALRAKVESTAIKTRSGNLSITISIGGYRTNSDLDESIKKADAALYKAKEGGRNKVEIYNK